MRKFFGILILLAAALPAHAGAINGGVEKQDFKPGTNQVIDSSTGAGISNAQIHLPTKNYSTQTDEDGKFDLGTQINAPTIMSVNKEGYRPYSLTIDSDSTIKPLRIGIEKSTPQDVIVETNLVHLGDDSFSANSANAGDFSGKSVGPFYSKNFLIKEIKPGEDAYLILGSIIGIDTLTARQLGQSKVASAYAAPPEVYCNGNKLADIKINGDSQEIKIPRSIIKPGTHNDITIKAGKNLFQTAYIDYDDIEFTNIRIEIR